WDGSLRRIGIKRETVLRDFKTEFKKFTVNSRRAPREVPVGHGPDQRADVRTYWRTSWCFRLRESPPIPFESIPLPRNTCFATNEQERDFLPLTDSSHPNHKQSLSPT